jgi:limonene-1,2-epoxide hydrolase
VTSVFRLGCSSSRRVSNNISDTDKDSELHLPVVGVFETSDGKIVAWRDYFDMTTVAAAFAAAQAGKGSNLAVPTAVDEPTP